METPKIELFRRRFIPNELIHLKEDKILSVSEDNLITSWVTIHPKPDFYGGVSIYYYKKHIKVSRFVREDGSLIFWYCDIIDYEIDKEKGIYTFIDLLADVVVMPNGFVKVLDLDELSEAFSRGQITNDQLNLALNTVNELLQLIYKGGFNELTLPIKDIKL